jgi:hypothetical protein
LRIRHLLIAVVLPVVAGAQTRETSLHPLISGDTIGAACSVRDAAATIQAWFVAMSVGDTAAIRQLARPALIVFSAGRNGQPEPFVRADSVDQLVRYVAQRHRVGDRWSLLEVRFMLVRGPILGFMPITRRDSRDAAVTKGLWLGKAEYECGRGVRVLNLAPWPREVPPYRTAARPPA